MKLEIATQTRWIRNKNGASSRKHFLVLLLVDGRQFEMECIGPDVAMKQALEVARSFGLDKESIRVID